MKFSAKKGLNGKLIVQVTKAENLEYWVYEMPNKTFAAKGKAIVENFRLFKTRKVGIYVVPTDWELVIHYNPDVW